MLRSGTVIRMSALALAVLLIGTSLSEAQDRRQRQRGSRFRGIFSRRGLDISVKFLQDELKLTSAQRQRVKEIELQQAGPLAFGRENIIKALGITSSQQEEIKKINDSAPSLRDLFRGQRGQRPNIEEIRKKIAAAQQEQVKKVLAVLTSSQRAKFTKMKGKPVDLTKLRRQRTRPKTRPDI